MTDDPKLRERQREWKKKWDDANPGYYTEYMRKWRAENPERAQAANRRTIDRQRRRENKRAAGRVYYAEHRDEERERARRFRKENPDKIREYQKRWREKDPEHAKAIGRRSGETYRDRHGDELRDRGRKAAAARRERDPELYKRWYEENLEAQRARGRAASQIRSRLKKLGLPPRSIHRVYAEEKRTNERDAAAFFERRRTPHEMQIIDAPDAGVHIRLRTAQIADRGIEQRRAADNFLYRLPTLMRVHNQHHGDRIREEIRMDNSARSTRGLEPYNLREETGRRVLSEVIENEVPRPQIAPERIGQMLAVLRRAQTTTDNAPTTPGTSDAVEALSRKVEQNARSATERQGHRSPESPTPNDDGAAVSVTTHRRGPRQL